MGKGIAVAVAALLFVACGWVSDCTGASRVTRPGDVHTTGIADLAASRSGRT